MGKLSPELLLAKVSDVESSFFRLMAVLRDYRQLFHHNYLYNELGEAASLHYYLNDIWGKRAAFLERLPHTFSVDRSIPWEPKLIYETYREDDAYLARVIELIELALPEIQKLIEEGARVFDFVQQHITVTELPGATPNRDVGYIIVFECEQRRWRLYNYSCTVLTSTKEPCRALTTKELKTVTDGAIARTLSARQWEFARQFPQLASSTAYFCEVKMDFPFNETTMPVIKRRLIKSIAA